MDRFLNTNEIDTATATCVDQIYELTQVNVETFKQNLSKIEEAKKRIGNDSVYKHIKFNLIEQFFPLYTDEHILLVWDGSKQQVMFKIIEGDAPHIDISCSYRSQINGIEKCFNLCIKQLTSDEYTHFYGRKVKKKMSMDGFGSVVQIILGGFNTSFPMYRIDVFSTGPKSSGHLIIERF